MLRLVFMVCMLNSPDICEEREMLIHEDMPVVACVMGAVPDLARWRETHPNWRVTRWRCEDDRVARTGALDTSHTLIR